LQDGVTMATQPTESKPRVRAGGDELAVIAQRAQAFTNASGTAIALSEGNADEIICRARSGAAAPEVGTALRVEGSFTGLCIQSGKELRCDDAETDTRVDTAAIRALGIKSMVVTPIKEDNKVIGVIACFAPTAHAFTITHVAVLKTMSDQISVLLQKERRMREEGIEPAPLAAPPSPAPRQAPGPVIIKPAPAPAANTSGPAVAAAPARTPVAVVNRVEPVKPAPLAAEVAAPINVSRSDKPEVRASFGTFESVAGDEKKGGNSSKLIAIVAVVVVAVAVTFYFVKGHKSASASSTTPSQPTQEVASAQPPATAGVVNPSSTANSNSPVSTSSSTVSIAKPAVVHESKPVEKPAAKAQERERAPEPVQQKSEPMTVSLNGGPSKLHAANTQNTDVAPMMTISSGNSGALTSLARPVAVSTPGIAQSELEPLKVLKTVSPIYPEIAKIRRLSGSVIVEVKVNKEGKVVSVRYVSGQAVFTDAAADAVRQWKFKPATLNGQAIEQTTQIKVDFRPS